MLFGSKKHQDFVLEKAQRYAEDLDVRLIFGAMVGSVSRGIQRADSDYDTRFLYLRKDFPEKICLPYQMGEDELVHRLWTGHPILERIPLWEATSFLHFLLEPRFTDETSEALYAIVGWTLQAPYVWDPYGLHSKLMPLVNRIFRKEYVISYYKTKVLEKYRPLLLQEMTPFKAYLYSVHAAASIEWCVRYSEFPPVDLETLLRGLGRIAMWEETKRVLYQARKDVRQVWEKSDSPQNLVVSISPTVLIPNNQVLLEYINTAFCQADLALEDTKSTNNFSTDDAQAIVNSMYSIIYRSVFENDEQLDFDWKM